MSARKDFNPGICSACNENADQGIMDPCDKHKPVKTKAGKCPKCGNNITCLKKIIQAREIWSCRMKGGEYSEDHLSFYEPEITTFNWLLCEKVILNYLFYNNVG